jgi:hypothetical protein
VHTARRAIKLLEVYDFDLTFLDCDLSGGEKGDQVASFIPHSRNGCPEKLEKTLYYLCQQFHVNFEPVFTVL